jgi:uncharacterized HAD superfamily protein
MASLNIAIDFDGTITADPILWRGFIENARYADHKVFIVTARRGTEENFEDIKEWLMIHDIQAPVYFTSLGSKIAYMKDRGIKVDIWIDDDPEALVRGH